MDPVRVALHGDDGFLLLPSWKNFFELPTGIRALNFRSSTMEDSLPRLAGCRVPCRPI